MIKWFRIKIKKIIITTKNKNKYYFNKMVNKWYMIFIKMKINKLKNKKMNNMKKIWIIWNNLWFTKFKIIKIRINQVFFKLIKLEIVGKNL